ncbi:MAG: hypothetical protein PVF61_09290, partial [Gammaproteobacteria bacterium]
KQPSQLFVIGDRTLEVIQNFGSHTLPFYVVAYRFCEHAGHILVRLGGERLQFVPGVFVNF